MGDMETEEEKEKKKNKKLVAAKPLRIKSHMLHA
jgi:hypothetical protein